MAVVLLRKSCFQAPLWMSTSQSASSSVEGITYCGNHGRRWVIERASCSSASSGTCIRYSSSRCHARCAASSGWRTLGFMTMDDHSTARKQSPKLAVKLLPKCSRSPKQTASPDWDGSEKERNTKDKEPGEEGSSAATRTFGAVCLIIGTSIGSGILALPQRTSPAGFVPSATSMVLCWAFLLLEALLIAEVNVSLLNVNMRKKQLAEQTTAGDHKNNNLVIKGDQELGTISFRTMAVETLGELGGSIATVTYVFLGYTSLIAYCSKSGELLSQLVSLPPVLLGSFFTLLIAALICFGGYRVADGFNQWLTAVMIGLLVVIEVAAGSIDKGSMGADMLVSASDDWSKVPPTIPLIIFSLVYHDITPVICSYLDGDINRIRFCMVIGSMVPLLGLLIWDAVMLGFLPSSSNTSILFSTDGGETAAGMMIEAFSILAVGTSLIGTLLGFSAFFQEQIRSRNKTQEGLDQADHQTTPDHRLDPASLLAMATAVVPALLTSASFTDAFNVATDFAGGYCMTILYGVLPPAMAWSMQFKKQEGGHNLHMRPEEDSAETGSRGKLLQAKPTLIVAGLFASGVAVLQVVNDCSSIIPSIGFFN